MSFGKKLSFLRKQRGMTQMELAEKLDISRQAVSRWERGTAEPSTENLVSIGKLFDVTVDTLINEDIQLQNGPAVQTAAAEDTTGDKGRYSIARLIGIVMFTIILVLTVFIFMRNGQKGSSEQNPIDIDDMEREMIDPNEWNTEDFLSDLTD